MILTVIDCFSKVAHFIPLPTLPSSKETAQAVLDHVFKIHGHDIVSDRGPRFVSQFWREYLEPLSWAEYTYNTLPSSFTVITPFRCCLGYQPTLFSSQELEASVPSIQALIKCCQRTLERVRNALCKTRECTCRATD